LAARKAETRSGIPSGSLPGRSPSSTKRAGSKCPLPLGNAYPKAQDLPDGKNPVSVYGYLVGGASLAVTKGAVARISSGLDNLEMGLQLQRDAAINPGNSCGPALVQDAMLGVVIDSSVESQNLGYVIPNEEIDGIIQRPGGAGGQPSVRSRAYFPRWFVARQK
jgi:hypothetical protein